MTTRIVVLGAGYSGQIAARLAARAKDTAVTLVNERPTFVERVRLHQLASGQELREVPLAKLVKGSGVELVIDRATSIDLDGKSVVLAGGRRLAYDRLIYALGSYVDLDAVPGAAEHAYTVATAEEAARLRARIADGGVVTVVGGGLTGLEAASELAEQCPSVKVRLLTAGALGERLSEKGRAHLRRAFDRLGVEVREHAPVTSVRADGVVLSDGAHVPSDVVVWTAGFSVPDLAASSGLAVDAHGRLVVDDSGRSVSHQDVYGVGDAAAMRLPGGQELRMACATGLPVAQQVVRAMLAHRSGKPVKPFRFRYVQQCVSLGRRDGLIQFVNRYDEPRERILTGRAAALYKEAIVRSALSVQRHPSMPTSL